MLSNFSYNNLEMFRYLKNENIQHGNKKGRSSFNFSTTVFFQKCTRLSIKAQSVPKMIVYFHLILKIHVLNQMKDFICLFSALVNMFGSIWALIRNLVFEIQFNYVVKIERYWTKNWEFLWFVTLSRKVWACCCPLAFQ